MQNQEQRPQGTTYGKATNKPPEESFEHVKNPDPRANENLPQQDRQKEQGNTEAELPGSEITDGEDG